MSAAALPPPPDLPAHLPRPVDDGAADHLPGMALPSVPLAATNGSAVDVAALPGTSVVFVYPRTGRPGEEPLVAHWDAIPGARGCTNESCAFRDLHADLLHAGADVVLGLSTMLTEDQVEAVHRLRLPFLLLSDAEHRLTTAARLPTFDAGGTTLLSRLTMLVVDGIVEHVWYPVFPPDTHADDVLRRLQTRGER